MGSNPMIESNHRSVVIGPDKALYVIEWNESYIARRSGAEPMGKMFAGYCKVPAGHDLFLGGMWSLKVGFAGGPSLDWIKGSSPATTEQVYAIQQGEAKS